MIASPVGDRSVGNGRAAFFYVKERPLRSSLSFCLRRTSSMILGHIQFHPANRPVVFRRAMQLPIVGEKREEPNRCLPWNPVEYEVRKKRPGFYGNYLR
jgi:hypothetical protein